MYIMHAGSWIVSRAQSICLTPVLMSLSCLACTTDPGPLGEWGAMTSEDEDSSTPSAANDASSPAQLDASVDAGPLSLNPATCSAQTSESACLAQHSDPSVGECLWQDMVATDGDCHVQGVERRCMFKAALAPTITRASICVDGGLSPGDGDSIWVRETNEGFEWVNDHERLRNSTGPVEPGVSWNWCQTDLDPLCACACRVDFPE